MSSPASFAVIAAAAVTAVLLAEALKRFRVPIVVLEVILGILIGPAVLHWANTSPFISGVADFGLAFLMFMAGYEIDYRRVRGAPLTRATVSWLISFGAALLVGAFLASNGWQVSDLLIGLVLTTTSMGALIPILDDAGVADKPFGAFAFGAGALGEFAPIIAITVLLIGDNPWEEALWLAAFVLVAAGLIFLASRPTPPRIDALISRHLATYGQLPVRVAVLLLAAMLFLAYELGVEALLGSFTAGILFRPMLSSSQREVVEPRLRAIGFGVAIPIFFIVSGMRFDLDSLTEDATSLATVPLLCGLMLLVRGVPALFVYRHQLSRPYRRSLVFLQATALPLVVVITEIGRQTQRMSPENAAALVGAAMLTMLIFPVLGLAQLRHAEPDDEPEPMPRLDH